ncbi:Transcriptional regulator, IclR family [Citrifermentans bremense]|jgi:DNA-binding IclR family transcriptional regulator|uniref:IclR family transcriptional regulator n=4 Tax=Geobacteraceae TaxID=213422 RepID=A0ABQ0MKL2_9BACT|nr:MULTISPECIES: IclR family transcriptional regulator [Geobacteraceae]QWV94088.1 IclR family transcriptional regulator [Geomonas oryzisoli]QXE89353.1 IclR family transcriptional regulator [Geomonas subterranea]QXM08532.1 IclR family transcriptional regulator [Geomonas subterranea]BCG45913.1 Transcriptional regulator, IclR family [Citrifermentans bremense]GAW67639.1 iclR family transcriptional regulator [Geoanaerobacter pelophilus]
MAKKEKSEYIIQAVSHALDLLEQFHDEVDELGVTELSKRLKLHKNNVFRLLATLESRNYIEQNKVTENYRLGLKTLELGQTFIKQMGLLRQSRPVLEALVKECNETTYVAILKEFHIVYLDVVETDLTVRVVPRVGARLPAYCTAAGKVQIAYMTDEELENYLPTKEMKRYTPKTVTDREELKKHLKVIAEQGYAIDDEEMDVGVKCVGAPIRDYTRRIIGAVSISGPSMRFTDERLEKELIPLVIRSGEEISQKLGYHK